MNAIIVDRFGAERLIDIPAPARAELVISKYLITDRARIRKGRISDSGFWHHTIFALDTDAWWIAAWTPARYPVTPRYTYVREECDDNDPFASLGAAVAAPQRFLNQRVSR